MPISLKDCMVMISLMGIDSSGFFPILRVFRYCKAEIPFGSVVSKLLSIDNCVRLLHFHNDGDNCVIEL